MKSSFLLLICAVAWGQQTPPPADPVVLTIGSEKITKSQFEDIISTLPEQQRAQAQSGPARRQLAERLAELKTLAQEAKNRKLDQSPKVQTQMKLQSEQLLASLAFQDLAGSAKVDEAAEHAYYDAHKGDWEEVKAHHILIRMKGSPVPLKDNEKDLTDEEALTKTKELRAKIEGGANFEEVAKAESDDAGTAPVGGDLGGFTKGRMVPEFDKAAFALEAGKVSEPVKTQFGYHLIKVDAHEAKPFAEVRQEIDQKIGPELAQKTAQQGLEELKKKTTVVYDDAYFGK